MSEGRADRWATIALAVAMTISVALSVWLTRGTTYSVDELSWFSTTPGLDLDSAFEPYIGHWILIPRITYAAILEALGPSYLPFRLLAAVAVVLAAGLFFVFARRRVGAVVALPPTLVLLFFGSDSLHTLTGNGFTVLLAVAAGIGALLALERGERRGDVAAMLLLCLGLVTYSVAAAFVAAAAALIVLGERPVRRLWVVLVPAALYVGWFAWSNFSGPSTTESNLSLSNLLLVPSWALDAVAAVGVALVGLDYSFEPDVPGIVTIDVGWGPVVAVVLLAAFAWRVSRAGVSRSMWVALAVPAALWLMYALAAAPEAGREPANPRYLLPSTFAVLLVAAEAARGVRLGRGAIIVLYAAAAFGLATNLALMRDASQNLREQADMSRARLTTLELAGAPGPFVRLRMIGPVMQRFGETHVFTDYADAARELGSPAFSLADLRDQPEPVRQHADNALVDNFGIRLRRARARPTGCERVTAPKRDAASFELPKGGAILLTGERRSSVMVRRFGDTFSVPIGDLAPDVPAELRVPTDAAPDPWYASTSARQVEVCDLPAGEE